MSVLVDLSKLSDVVKNDIVKKINAYDKLVTKVNNTALQKNFFLRV